MGYYVRICRRGTPVFYCDGKRFMGPITEYMIIRTTNPKVAQEIERRLRIRLARRGDGYYLYDSTDPKEASKIGNVMVQLKREGYRL